MSNTPHELSEDFPNDGDRIHTLKMENAHFAKLVEEYHDLNRKVHRAETGIEPREELAEVDLRKRRMRVKDEIASMLAKA